MAATTVPGKNLPKVKLPGSNRFALLTGAENLPPGTIVDLTGNGGIRLTDPKGNEMSFYGQADGVPSRFVYKGIQAGFVQLVLTGGSFSKFERRTSAAGAKAKKPVRRLWGNGRGRFTTKGKYAAATVRGTWWRIADFKTGTQVYVRRGVVAVRSFVLAQTVRVTAGHIYFAPSKKPAKKKR